MTPAELQILSDYIETSPDLSAIPETSDGAVEVARLLNLDAPAPTNLCWKRLVPLVEIAQAFDNAELELLSPEHRERLQTLALYMAGGMNPSLANVRAFFENIFAGVAGQDTREALLAVWTKILTRGERIYASGTGSELDPALLTFEGAISPADVEAARNLP